MNVYYVLLCITFMFASSVGEENATSTCEVSMEIESGLVCGRIRTAELGVSYASFRGVPYSEQPLKENRFAKLIKKEAWSGYLNATEDGPICPQQDDLYRQLVYPNRTISEECIHANVHVPLADGVSLPASSPGLPILVFVHGGGFQVGSGDADVHGPEYFVSKGIIVITFNYRINVFGFLSLNSTEIPGNTGLRDVFTLLQWVQDNAKAFGGNPENVTLAGQSAGAAVAHLVSLVHDCKSLFNSVILMSGTGVPNFYSASPTYASTIATSFLTEVGINSTDTVYIYNELINMPLEEIMKANAAVQNTYGLVSFVPVVESPHSGDIILDENPYNMVKKGRGNQCPLIIGFTSAEGEFFRARLVELDIVGRVENNSLTVLSPRYAYELESEEALSLATQVEKRYFNGSVTVDGFKNILTDTYFKYPALSVARLRAASGGEPVYMYYYAYQSNYSVIQQGLGIEPYKGAAHVEDVTYVFRENMFMESHVSFPPTNSDDLMKDEMTNYFINFINCSDPTCGGGESWTQVSNASLSYRLIQEPGVIVSSEPNAEQLEMMQFFDYLAEQSGLFD